MSNKKRRSRSHGPLLISALAAASVVVLLAGCHLFGTSRAVENYFPLAVGNQWCWVLANNPADSVSIEISGSHPVNGITFYKFTSPGDTSFANWFVHSNGELKMYSTESDTAPADTAGKDYFVWLKEPFDSGASWPQPNDSAETLRIVANDVTLTVPAGTFEHCVRVEASDMGSSYYYAPGVGWVRIDEGPDTTDAYVLKRYVTK